MKTLADTVVLLHRGVAPGTPLSSRDLRRALAWTRDILKDLDRLHRRGDFHGGISPHAVTLGARGARLARSDGREAPYEYRDPERTRRLNRDVTAARDAEPRHDLYGVGASLFAMLEGGPPHCGPASAFTRSVPNAVAYVAARAMADGTARYPTARDMRDDVVNLLRRKDLDKVRPEELPSFCGGPARAPVMLKPFAVRQKEAGRRRVLGRLVVAGLVIFGLGRIAMDHRAQARAGERAVPVMTSPQTVIAAKIHRGSPLAELVMSWRDRLGDRLTAAGEVFDPSEIPLVVVSDSKVDEEFGWLRYPSRRLSLAVEKILLAGGGAAEVQEMLLETLGRDTLPAVLHVRPGAVPGTLTARLLYRAIDWRQTVRSVSG